MHELGLAQSVFDTVNHYIKDKDVTRVISVNLTIGKLRNVFPDSLTFCFEAISKDSKAEGSKMIINSTDIVGKCKTCENEFIIIDNSFICTACGHNNVEVIKGSELLIESIEVEYGN